MERLIIWLVMLPEVLKRPGMGLSILYTKVKIEDLPKQVSSAPKHRLGRSRLWKSGFQG